MSAMKGYYSLIQFCPDPSRAEAVNVGVLLFCPEAAFIGARTSVGNRRPAKLVGYGNLDRASLNSAKRSMERRLEVDRESFKTLDDLQSFVDSRANALKLTAPRPVKVCAPQEDLDRLFDELVGGRARRRRAQVVAPQLDSLFRRLEQENRARRNWTLSVPVLGRELRIPYAYHNGVWNLVKTHRFSCEESSAINAAVRLAVEGDLLERHLDDEIGEKHLIVVSAFEQTEAAEALEQRVTQILHEYRVRTVGEAEVDGFATEIEQQAH